MNTLYYGGLIVGPNLRGRATRSESTDYTEAYAYLKSQKKNIYIYLQGIRNKFPYAIFIATDMSLYILIGPGPPQLQILPRLLI
jgi:hypothetical protein